MKFPGPKDKGEGCNMHLVNHQDKGIEIARVSVPNIFSIWFLVSNMS